MFRTIPHAGVLAFLLFTAFAGSFGSALAQISPGEQQSAAQTATITGSITQSDGSPAAGVQVRLNAIGPGAHLTTITNARGAFTFTSVPYGTYGIDAVGRNQQVASREGISVRGDINIAIQFLAQTPGLKVIANVSTRSAGAQINVTPASIASVNPTQYAFQGNASWLQLLQQIPGVAVSGLLFGGNTAIAQIPGSPFQPVILSINGALPYETATTMDGMPLSNYSTVSSPGSGVNLNLLPMPLFETADVIRGPGANAPSILDSVGGSFVLHAPGAVEKNTFEASVSNDAYGGSFANAKMTFLAGKLSGTVVYGFNNSPGPLPVGPFFFGFSSSIANWQIDGSVVKRGGSIGNAPAPFSSTCTCYFQDTLMGRGSYQNTSWSSHNGGIGLSYQVAPKVTAQVFYAGSQATSYVGSLSSTFLFVPASAYSGSLTPGSNYVAPVVPGSTGYGPPILQSSSLVEEKITAYLGPGVLRLAALQNLSFRHQDTLPGLPFAAQLYGTACLGSGPVTSDCPSGGTLTAYNGTMATLTPSISDSLVQGAQASTHDLLASYDTQLGANSDLGISFVKSVTGSSNFGVINVLTTGATIPFGNPQIVTQSTNEFRLHGGTQLSDAVALFGSYYMVRANYHVPSPADPTHNTWVDSPFSYSAPRLGVTWRVNHDVVVRAAAGGGFALPPIYNLVGSNGSFGCPTGPPPYCSTSLTNTNLQPEKAFALDVGTDVRLRPDTVVSADVYRTDLYGQLFQASNYTGQTCGAVPACIANQPGKDALPVYIQEYLNIAHSRFEGINLSLRRDVTRGVYWNAGLGLTRGYIISVPSGFYNVTGQTCNTTTGAGCQNAYAVANQNYDGKFQSTVPYANGILQVGYRWAPKKSVDIQANYLGNNNAYFQPGFVEFDAHASYPLTKTFSIIAALTNITGIHGESYQSNISYNPPVLAPTIAGAPLPLNPIPYGPRTLVITANIQM